jgi:hypothetical protein
MPILIWELKNSRQLDVSIENPSALFSYFVTGTFDETAVRLAVEGTISPSYGAPGGVLPFQTYRVQTDGAGLWKAEVHYGPRFPRGWQTTLPGGQGRLWTFDISTQSTKITQSKDTVARYGPPTAGNPSGINNAPDCKGAIGVNGDQVAGCEIDVPVITFAETVYYERSVVDVGFLQDLVAVAQAPVNDNPFRGFQPGEVRYLGTHGSERDYENWELTHRFAVSLNSDTIMAGDIGPITKKGWEYLWVHYQDVVDSNQLVKHPVAAYVEQVYDSSDYSVFDTNGDGTPDAIDWPPGTPLGGN